MIVLRILKYLALGVLALVAVVALAVAFLWWRGPAQRKTTAVVFPRTPERVARGKYLAEHAASCMFCHSPHEEGVWGRPSKPGMEGFGYCFEEEDLGTVCPSNITPDPVAGIGAWSDDELARAIREEVGRDGKPFFPFHAEYRYLSDDDLQAIVAFLRSLPPSSKVVARSRYPFPLLFLTAFTGDMKPTPITQPVKAPDPKDTVAYGQYLTKVAECVTCHSPLDVGQPIPGQEFSGGQIIHHTVRSANLTPDPTGLGNHTKQDFIGMFRAYSTPAGAHIEVSPDRNTGMPWVNLSGMTDEDLGAIYDFLRTVKPIHNTVEKFVTRSAP